MASSTKTQQYIWICIIASPQHKRSKLLALISLQLKISTERWPQENAASPEVGLTGRWPHRKIALPDDGLTRRQMVSSEDYSTVLVGQQDFIIR